MIVTLTRDQRGNEKRASRPVGAGIDGPQGSHPRSQDVDGPLRHLATGRIRPPATRLDAVIATLEKGAVRRWQPISEAREVISRLLKHFEHFGLLSRTRGGVTIDDREGRRGPVIMILTATFSISSDSLRLRS